MRLTHTIILRAFAALFVSLVISSLAHPYPSPSDRLEVFEGDYLIEPVRTRAQLAKSQDGTRLFLHNGLIQRSFVVEPNAGTVSLERLWPHRSVIRSVRPEAQVTLEGLVFDVGGLIGQSNHAFLPDLESLQADPLALQFAGLRTGAIEPRLSWKRVRHHDERSVWPPSGIHLEMDYVLPKWNRDELESYLEGEEPGNGTRTRWQSARAAKGKDAFWGAWSKLQSVTVTVHYALYDGIPAYSKWLTIHNGSESPVLIDRFRTETLAVIEQSSQVETRDGVAFPLPQSLHVETDFAFGGMTPSNANRHVVHWRVDPLYHTQVNYLKQTPCLLEVEPTYGPAQVVAPGGGFETFRTFVLVHDSEDRERRGLALRKLYRVIAPWVTENPLMHHMRLSDLDKVRKAIVEAKAVGFEMVILSFGSGFNIEDRSEMNLRQWREMATFAQEQGVELGGYSLFSSRRIGNGNDIVSPEGQRPTHGNCPAVTSEWGQKYMQTLYDFFQETGFDLLEHDGPYPGDVDVTPRPPWQKGIDDSRWVQWRQVSDFYRWCRGQGIYLNTPDYYYLSGSNKCGMGYREVNWSLPRAQQVIHTRQNIYDGTWQKTPSMGWMFVPLTEYHGGGAAATIEPLVDHLDHYANMLRSNLAHGVQACYRGPRLFDGEKTQRVVTQWVNWFKTYRGILESDVIHGKRADGHHLDWMMHVNPSLETRGMILIHNPKPTPVHARFPVNLYYTGIRDRAEIAFEDQNAQDIELEGTEFVLEVEVPPQGMRWAMVREPRKR